MMETPTQIDDLPDDVLVKALWPSERPKTCRSESDLLWATLPPWPSHVKENPRLREIAFGKSDDPLSALPESTDAEYNLLIAAVCTRWRKLAKRHVTTLHVREGRVVSRADLKAAIKCFPRLTRLHLADSSLETIDDAFLAHLASSCSQLTVLHVGNKIAPSTDIGTRDEEPITEEGLDHFLQLCTKLEQLSLRCLPGEIVVPNSLFQLTRLRSLALSNSTLLDFPQVKNLASLTAVYMQTLFVDYSLLSNLTPLSSLTSLTLPSQVDRLGGDADTFAFAELQSLESLKVGGSVPFDVMFPGASTCSRLKRLQLVRCNTFETLPDDVGHLLPSLEELSILSCKQFSELPEQFTSLRHLHTLKISTCSVLSLPANFGELPSLKSLVLHFLPLTDLPESIYKLTSLETLFVFGCEEICQLPSQFHRLTSLKSLCFMNMSDLPLPDNIGELANLHTFLLSGNSTRRNLFPFSFSELSSLTRLEIKDCMAASLPECMWELRSLRELYIHFCPRLEEIPNLLTDLTSLEVLSIGDCSRLTDVPSRLDSLTRLKQFTLSRCELVAGPYLLPCSLEVLSLGDEWRVSLLPDISMMPNLRRLNLGLVCNNDGLPSTSNLSSLEHLELALEHGETELLFPLTTLSGLRSLKMFVGMNSLPNGFCSLQQLKKLHIEGAELTELPVAITELQQLTFLEIHAPRLTSLPDCIGAISRLRKLDLSYCSALAELPASITSLSCLNELNLCNTAIRLLPLNLPGLTRLKDP